MTDYMKYLRSKLGHVPLMQCAASVILYKNNKVLLQKRSDTGMWCYHGGAIELGESAEEAAKRELLEETGLQADFLELFGVYSGSEFHYIYPNDDEVYIIDVVFLCNEFHGDLAESSEETKCLKWFQYNDIPSNLMPPIKKPLFDFIVCRRKEYENKY